MKELKIRIPIEKGYGTKTIKLNGEIDSILLNLPRGEILIESEYGYKIYENKEINGVCYIPIRIQAHDQNGHRISFSDCKFNIGEKLIIQVKTLSYLNSLVQKQEARMIIRYE